MKHLTKLMAGFLCISLLMTGLVGCKAKDKEETKGSDEAPFERTELPDYSWDKVDLAKFVTLGEFEGIKYTPASTEVKEADVDELMKQLQEGSATATEIKKGTVKDGDTVNVDYVGRIDGEAFEGGSAKNQTIIIGQSSMIPGFVEGLIGKEIGSEVVLDLKFPEDYWNEELAGVDAEFTIKINFVAGENVVPEITDEWANTVTGGQYPTVEKLREYFRESLEEEAVANAEGENQVAVWNQVIANATIKEYPEGALDYYYAEQKRQMEDMAIYYGMTDFDAFIKAIGYTEEKFEKEMKESAESYCESIMVARALLKEVGKEVTDAEYQKEVDTLAEDYGYEDKDLLVKDYGGEVALWDTLILDRAVMYVMEKAVEK